MPTAGIAQAGWSSLEIAKLLVQVTTPLTVAFIGYWLNHRLKSLEAAQWSQQKIIERRIEAYDRLTPDLNRLYCFFAYVGTWKEITPPQAIALKRSLDQVAYIQAPLFDASFLKKYNEFMDGCFATYQGWGEDPKLRTSSSTRVLALGDDWNPAWDDLFSKEGHISQPGQVAAKYSILMSYFAQSIGATKVDQHIVTGTIPRIYPIYYYTAARRKSSDINDPNHP